MTEKYKNLRIKYIHISIQLFLINLAIHSQDVTHFSTKWYGPNAQPIPEITDGTIAKLTTFSLNGDYYFGYGDQTVNSYLRIEIPLLSEKISIKSWMNIYEQYKVEPTVGLSRGMQPGNLKGNAVGDIYLQTRIRLLEESRKKPSLILNYTLKTSSGTGVHEKRNFNRTGYYFDFESGKTFNINSRLLDDLRWVAMAGFLCWETIDYTQNDGPMYGTKIKLSKNKIEWEGGIRAYSGWMGSHPNFNNDHGDRPIVIFSAIHFKTIKNRYFFQYQYGIRDFPYHQIRLGIELKNKKLTPVYR
jgi:hypothetical protein